MVSAKNQKQIFSEKITVVQSNSKHLCILKLTSRKNLEKLNTLNVKTQNSKLGTFRLLLALKPQKKMFPKKIIEVNFTSLYYCNFL